MWRNRAMHRLITRMSADSLVPPIPHEAVLRDVLRRQEVASLLRRALTHHLMILGRSRFPERQFYMRMAIREHSAAGA